MSTLFIIILATFIVSLISLVGVFTIGLKTEMLNKVLSQLVALSSGALLGGAFMDLFPEGMELLEPKFFFAIILATLLIFLLVEKFFHWRHCHSGPDCETHTFGYMNLIGDGVHNFIDGLIIASAFVLDLRLGAVTTLAIALHEIPQEIGDYGVMVYAGFEKNKALFMNFLFALFAILGGVLGWALTAYVDNITKFLLPIAGGGFLYISLSDMLPELRKEPNIKKFVKNFIFILVGIAIVYLASHFE